MDSDSSIRESIRQDLSSMTLAEILKMKEELGARVYNEAILGGTYVRPKKKIERTKEDLKRSNKNCPREMMAKRQVPFLGDELRKKCEKEADIRDPRFDANAGEFKIKHFKEDYKFLTEIRDREIAELRTQYHKTKDEDKRKVIKQQMQRLKNKNLEERKWHEKQNKIKEEKKEIQRTLLSNQIPIFLTKKERRAKELVEQFESLKKTGKLNKHLERRRKKNAAKDRKKISLD